MVAKRGANKEKKVIWTKYGRERLEHARGGLKSFIMGVLTLVLLFLVLLMSFFVAGEVNMLAAIVVILIGYLAIRGIRYGIAGFKEKQKSTFFCKVGIGLNGLVLLGLLLIFVRGLF